MLIIKQKKISRYDSSIDQIIYWIKQAIEF